MTDFRSSGSAFEGKEAILRALFVENKTVQDIHDNSPATTDKRELLNRTAYDGFEEGVIKQVEAYERHQKKSVFAPFF
jgi:hypothetical protein